MREKKTKGAQTVTVNVYALRKAEGLPVQVVVKPDLLDLSHCDEGAVTIQWQLNTVGYRFPDEGAVAFTSPGSRKAIGPSKLVDDGRGVVARVVKFTGLTYAYSVTVVDESTGLTAVVDPSIHIPPH